MSIPEELVYKIINYVNDIQKYKCQICHKKISCIDDHIYNLNLNFVVLNVIYLLMICKLIRLSS